MAQSATTSPIFPPGPAQTPLFGTLRAYRHDPLGYLVHLRQTYGDTVRYLNWPLNVIALFHPDSIRDVLVTNQQSFVQGPTIKWVKIVAGGGMLTAEGEAHIHQRQLAQPAFHRQRIAGYAETMTRLGLAARDTLHDGGTVDIAEHMAALTLSVVSNALFGVDLTPQAHELGEAVGVVNLYMGDKMTQLLGDLFYRLPLPSTRHYRRALARLNAAMYGIIAERRRGGEDTGDLLSMMLNAPGGGYSDELLRDELLTFFVAGHETTANLLTWALYLLSQNQQAEAALLQEIDRELDGRTPGLDDLPRLRYAEMVLSESLRLYPPAWGIARQVQREYETGGYRLPAGSVFVVSQWVTHRDPRWFPEPEAFRPERWTPEFRAALPRFAYFPFGGGSRQCIGESFALLEATLLLALYMQRWQFRLAASQPIEPLPVVSLRPRGGMPMAVQARKAALAGG